MIADEASPELAEIRRNVLEMLEAAEELWLKTLKPALEKKDITKGGADIFEGIEEAEEERELCEVEKILADTDLNTLSPMQALLLLSDLKEKVKTEN